MYIATYIIDLAALLYLLGLLYTSTALNIYRKKPFLIGIILTVIIIVSEAGTVFTDNGIISLRSINIFCNILGFALTPMIPIVLTTIFDRRILGTHKLLLVPTLINIVATVLSPLFRFIFYVDVNNQYMRGDYFFIFITVYIINFLFLVISTLDVGKKYNYPIMRKMVALSLFTIIGTSIQLVDPLAYSSWHCVTLSLFLYFLLMSEFDSSFDTLTGLYNRAAFDKAAKQIVGPKAFSVIILDINDFKSVNDTYGHDYGDTVIKAVAAIIRESFNKHYTCYRFGGDEFSIIGNETDQEKIEHQLRTMTNTLAEMREKGNPLPTVSYGYSIFRGGEKLNFHKNLKDADDQMYHFKKLHKAGATHETTVPVSVHDT
ncbi:diguanylate cyclase/phosphodiesterase (ggdef & eal domains) with pas/pac sensor(s) [hydrocarbon metagenome]|uniref:Diguanylate cyclase/phosphodiesterase (Ggdef & eal domains) with pas/pac sensor(S) n=1 Tax=hydrocarbon metagenome TaxID=938273 RepID=A0A0W8E897_9ZZZZ